MMQITLRLKPPWPLIELTRQNPSVTILHWCNFSADFYRLQTTKANELQSTTDAFLATRRKLGFVLQKQVNVGTNAAFFVMRCNHAKRGSVEEIMHKFSCLPICPFLFQEGWFKITGICFDEDRIRAMFRRLSKFGELKVDHKAKIDLNLLRESFMIPTSVIVAGLTSKQANSLLAAVAHGYYQVPRKVRFGYISKSVRIPRTTYEEHVRKAESKVINAVAPYISLFFATSGRELTA